MSDSGPTVADMINRFRTAEPTEPEFRKSLRDSGQLKDFWWADAPDSPTHDRYSLNQSAERSPRLFQVNVVPPVELEGMETTQTNELPASFDDNLRSSTHSRGPWETAADERINQQLEWSLRRSQKSPLHQRRKIQVGSQSLDMNSRQQVQVPEPPAVSKNLFQQSHDEFHSSKEPHQQDKYSTKQRDLKDDVAHDSGSLSIRNSKSDRFQSNASRTVASDKPTRNLDPAEMSSFTPQPHTYQQHTNANEGYMVSSAQDPMRSSLDQQHSPSNNERQFAFIGEDMKAGVVESDGRWTTAVSLDTEATVLVEKNAADVVDDLDRVMQNYCNTQNEDAEKQFAELKPVTNQLVSETDLLVLSGLRSPEIEEITNAQTVLQSLTERARQRMMYVRDELLKPAGKQVDSSLLLEQDESTESGNAVSDEPTLPTVSDDIVQGLTTALEFLDKRLGAHSDSSAQDRLQLSTEELVREMNEKQVAEEDIDEHIPVESITDIKRAFELRDWNQNGFVSIEDVALILQRFHRLDSNYEHDKLLQLAGLPFGESASRHVTWDEFLQLRRVLFDGKTLNAQSGTAPTKDAEVQSCTSLDSSLETLSQSSGEIREGQKQTSRNMRLKGNVNGDQNTQQLDSQYHIPISKSGRRGFVLPATSDDEEDVSKVIPQLPAIHEESEDENQLSGYNSDDECSANHLKGGSQRTRADYTDDKAKREFHNDHHQVQSVRRKQNMDVDKIKLDSDGCELPKRKMRNEVGDDNSTLPELDDDVLTPEDYRQIARDVKLAKQIVDKHTQGELMILPKSNDSSKVVIDRTNLRHAIQSATIEYYKRRAAQAESGNKQSMSSMLHAKKGNIIGTRQNAVVEDELAEQDQVKQRRSVRDNAITDYSQLIESPRDDHANTNYAQLIERQLNGDQQGDVDKQSGNARAAMHSYASKRYAKSYQNSTHFAAHLNRIQQGQQDIAYFRNLREKRQSFYR